ncbi:hypothetical protein [Streptomyces mirabilis]|uniref:Uncharacterized protein n=1 Tax=Streptomyces mirabilis TaxID=68239 RepID=A0ABU3V252_9ACTN|nr:hypothetical protein [Streptomyces mirabilis]MCX5346347.1 hypothetical protein [Streptomyces mirabilis]MDU9000258.1 hypothetical protein [Streptomyces mirabilis]
MNQTSYVLLLVIVIDRFTVPPGWVVALSVVNVRSAGAGSAGSVRLVKTM